ncbi:hypothetical protein ACIRSU_17080 [Streptomyces sp. NPDC101160]|uniref:hypothetical protein n=1 Tax=Streptomyces sp. NPDC101160 TaxID=3366118 RepID=UPI0038025B41
MKYVKVEWDDEFRGFALDANAYLTELPRLGPELPPGARAFVVDPEHYRVGADRCVKDLELAGVRLATDKSGSLVLDFAPNRWKHEEGLRIRYSGVAHFSVDYDHAIDWMAADTVLFDEVLPDPAGCVHEIALTDATVTVRCRDLDAVWGGGPNDPARPRTGY